MTEFHNIFKHKNPWIFSKWELNCFMRTIDTISDKLGDKYDYTNIRFS